MQQREEQSLPEKVVRVPEDTRDCMQCLILMYGETHIDTLAQLLNLTAYAEIEYTHVCIKRRC